VPCGPSAALLSSEEVPSTDDSNPDPDLGSSVAASMVFDLNNEELFNHK